MSYEEEKQDRKIEQLEAEIERLRGELASANVELLAAGELVTQLNRAREAEIDQAGAAERMYLEGVRAKDTRIQELEDALAEERAKRNAAGHGDCFYRTPSRTDPLVWKCDKGVICDWNCCPIKNEKRTDALQELQAEGKIGPDTEPANIQALQHVMRKQHDHPAEMAELNADHQYQPEAPRSWQITDERIPAIENAISSCVLIERYTGQDLRQETTALRAMLKEAGQ